MTYGFLAALTLWILAIFPGTIGLAMVFSKQGDRRDAQAGMMLFIIMLILVGIGVLSALGSRTV